MLPAAGLGCEAALALPRFAAEKADEAADVGRGCGVKEEKADVAPGEVMDDVEAPAAATGTEVK